MATQLAVCVLTEQSRILILVLLGHVITTNTWTVTQARSVIVILSTYFAVEILNLVKLSRGTKVCKVADQLLVAVENPD